jgi:hypothetical protein
MKSKLYILAFSISLFSCTKLEFEPENAVSADALFKSKDDFKRVLNNVYDNFANQMNGNIPMMSELLADNIDPVNLSTEYGVVYKRATFKFRTGDCLNLYTGIYHANYVIEKLKTNEVGFTQQEKDELDAEARFLRAWSHWEMLKLYAHPYGYTSDNSHPGVPIRTDTEYKVEIRSSVSKCYTFIINELTDIENKLADTKPFSATKWSAKALLAKVYFQMHDYTKALTYADDVIKNSGFRLSDSVNRILPSSSVEHIFSLISTLGNNKSNSLTGNYRSDVNPNPSFRAVKSLALLSVGSDSDKRASLYKVNKPNTPQETWVFTKYNKDVFNIPLLHLTDMVLTRAECYAINGEPQKAYDDLMLIRKRAYGAGNRTFDKNISTLQDSIQYERRIEMATEGDRLQQLKRLGSEGKNILIRNAPWNCPGMLLQFPISFTTEGFIFNEEGGCN